MAENLEIRPQQQMRELPEGEEFLADIQNVGPDKPLGYLTPQAIAEFGHSTVEGEIARAKRQGLSAEIIDRYFPPFVLDGKQFPGHNTQRLFVWDDIALSALLRKNESVLNKHGWPTDPIGFVHAVGANTVPRVKT